MLKPLPSTRFSNLTIDAIVKSLSGVPYDEIHAALHLHFVGKDATHDELLRDYITNLGQCLTVAMNSSMNVLQLATERGKNIARNCLVTLANITFSPTPSAPVQPLPPVDPTLAPDISHLPPVMHDGTARNCNRDNPPCNTGNKVLPTHFENQCDNPIGLVDDQMTLPSGAGLEEIGKWYLNKCVTASWEDWDGTKWYINTRVGQSLPQGECSEKARLQNDPNPTWDFAGNGWCGQGACPDPPRFNNVFDFLWSFIWGGATTPGCTDDVISMYPLTFARVSCVGHDVCVWARCGEDELVPSSKNAAGGNILNIFNDDVLRDGDPVCGKAISNTRSSFLVPNNSISSSRIKRFFDMNPGMRTNCDWECIKSKDRPSNKALNYAFSGLFESFSDLLR
jgi:hypothetical protein